MTGARLRVAAVLNPGAARGRVLKLTEPLSFWGGFNPVDGRIIDRHHPQADQSIAGTVLALPGSRGSAGTPGGVADALRRKVGPVAVVLVGPDVNITTGAQVADRLYGTETPVVTVSAEDFAALRPGMTAEVSETELVLHDLPV